MNQGPELGIATGKKGFPDLFIPGSTTWLRTALQSSFCCLLRKI